jgi:hypothetical protein
MEEELQTECRANEAYQAHSRARGDARRTAPRCALTTEALYAAGDTAGQDQHDRPRLAQRQDAAGLGAGLQRAGGHQRAPDRDRGRVDQLVSGLRADRADGGRGSPRASHGRGRRAPGGRARGCRLLAPGPDASARRGRPEGRVRPHDPAPRTCHQHPTLPRERPDGVAFTQLPPCNGTLGASRASSFDPAAPIASSGYRWLGNPDALGTAGRMRTCRLTPRRVSRGVVEPNYLPSPRHTMRQTPIAVWRGPADARPPNGLRRFSSGSAARWRSRRGRPAAASGAAPPCVARKTQAGADPALR